jgi:hypothetical protein
VSQGDDGGAHQDQHAEQEARTARAELVVEHAPEENDEDGGHGVGRVEIADGAAAQMQILNERGREGSDAVVGKIASHHNQADEHQDGEAVGTSGWMEESQGIRSCSSRNGPKA